MVEVKEVLSMMGSSQRRAGARTRAPEHLLRRGVGQGDLDPMYHMSELCKLDGSPCVGGLEVDCSALQLSG